MIETNPATELPERGVDAPAPARLFHAALESFAEVGYHAATTRDIAERAGMSPAAVYVHYKSKLDLLAAINHVGYESARECLEVAMTTGETHSERVANGIRAFAAWHGENHTLSRVVQYEYTALSGPAREEIRVLRRRMQRDVELAIRDGIEAGEFAPVDYAGAALALVSCCVDIARWYAPGSSRSPADLGDLYADLSLRMLTNPAPRSKKTAPAPKGGRRRS